MDIVPMRKISLKNKRIIESDPFFKECALKGIHSSCGGRLTIEHALTYSSKQIDELWNFVSLCEKHHAVGMYLDAGTIQKERNVWIALNRATDQELVAISKAIDYIFLRNRLNKKYGVYKKPNMISIKY